MLFLESVRHERDIEFPVFNTACKELKTVLRAMCEINRDKKAKKSHDETLTIEINKAKKTIEIK